MSQATHNDCWVRATDPPKTSRRIIIWTKKPWAPKGVISRHLDMDGAWYDRKQNVWFHGDGSIAEDVTYWMEIPHAPHLQLRTNHANRR